MSGNKTFSILAVFHEINERELKENLSGFPQDLQYYATLAAGIIGTENSKRIGETPEGVSGKSEELVSNLLELTDVGAEERFRSVLETCLIKTMHNELRSSCCNCLYFNKCLDIENLAVGELFRRRVHGEETPELRAEISKMVSEALKRTPHFDTDDAHIKCDDFRHQYSPSSIGEVFGRYSDIAADLHNRYGIDYQKIQQEMIAVNMTFMERQIGPGRN